MNRRKAILGIFSIGGTAAIGISGIKFYSLKTSPDLGFIDSKRELIADLAEAIIPRTDTPGAKDAKVEIFIINSFKGLLDTKEQNNFVNGIKELMDICEYQFQKSFSECTRLQQQEVLAIMEGQQYEFGFLQKIRERALGKSFFDLLKELTVKGYCNSQIGATQGLTYVAIPGEYRPCTSIHPDEKAWATN